MKQTSWKNGPLQPNAEGELNDDELGQVSGGSDLCLMDGQPEGQMTEVHDMLSHMVGKADEAAGSVTLPDRPLKTPEEEMAGLKETMQRPSGEWTDPIRHL